jgi:hypothetical protein
MARWHAASASLENVAATSQGCSRTLDIRSRLRARKVAGEVRRELLRRWRLIVGRWKQAFAHPAPGVGEFPQILRVTANTDLDGSAGIEHSIKDRPAEKDRRGEICSLRKIRWCHNERRYGSSRQRDPGLRREWVSTALFKHMETRTRRGTRRAF